MTNYTWKNHDQPTPEQVISLRERERRDMEEMQRCHCARPIRRRMYGGIWSCVCGKAIEK